jgi:general secretion pathway protein K
VKVERTKQQVRRQVGIDSYRGPGAGKEKNRHHCVPLKQFKLFQRFDQSDCTGSALIITLLLVAILVSLVVNFVYEVQIDMSTLSNWIYAQKASFVAKSGQNLSAQYISETANEAYTYEQKTELPIEQHFAPNVNLTVDIEDENSRFNVNSIVYQNGATNEKSLASLKKLLEYLNINPNQALIIADWIDPDSEPRAFDSETSSKNDFLWSTDELKLIDGIDEDTFQKLRPYITVFGNNQININTADVPVLISLGPDMTEELANRIVEYRKNSPFENKNQIVRVTGLEAVGIKILDRITVKAEGFRVISKATVNEITRVIESVVDSSLNIYFWREG